MKETWEYYSVPQNEDVMKSMLGERIEHLEMILARKDVEITGLEEEIERLLEGKKMSYYGFIRENAELKDELAKKDKAYLRLKAHLETCQDAYDRDVP